MTSKLRHYGAPQVNTKRKLNRWRNHKILERQREKASHQLTPDRQKAADRVHAEGLEGVADA